MKGRHSLLLKRIVTFMITILLTFTSISVFNTLTADASFIGSLVDGWGASGGGAGTHYIKNGVSQSRLGYLCYPVMAEGGAAVPGGSAKFFTAPGWNPVSGSKSMLEPRRGQYGEGSPSGAAPWNLTPFNVSEGNNYTTNMPQIKQWFQASGATGSNGGMFVEKYWGLPIAEKFSSGDVVLVVETVMNFQYSKGSGGATPTKAEAMAYLESKYGGGSTYSFLSKAYNAGIVSDGQWEQYIDARDSGNSSVMSQVTKGIMNAIAVDMVKELQSRGGGGAGNQVMYGVPITATIPKAVAYKNSLGISGYNKTNVDSWVQQAAPDSEKIFKGDIGERAGYVADYSPAPFQDGQLTPANNGLAMFVISCKEDLIHTYWAANGSPGDPEPASPNKIGKYNIYKIYHTKKYKNGVMIEDTFNDGTFHTEQCIPDISVDDEPDEYHLEYWSSDTGTGDPSSSTEVLAKHGPQNGTGPKVITLSKQDRNEQSVYVVLVKEENEEEEEDYNWLLTQSMITRTVWENYPDHQLGMELIKDHEFEFKSPAHSGHSHPCGPHSCDGCETDDNGGTYCPGNHYDDLNEHESLDNYIYSNRNIKFSIYNSLKAAYPDIHATKELDYWAREFFHGRQYVGEEKRWEPKIPPMGWSRECFEFYRDPSDFDLTHAKVPDSYASKSQKWEWEYVCVLMRGKDKLTVAEWANDDDECALPGPTTANENLADMSSSGFAVGNTNQGTRKTDTYYEKFNMNFVKDSKGDYITEVTPKIPTHACMYCGTFFDAGDIKDKQIYALNSPMAVNNIVVKIETYSGNPNGGTMDTAWDSSDKIMGLPAMPTFASSFRNTVSGRMIQAESISFLPYVLMKYQTEPSGRVGWPNTYENAHDGWLKAHVLGRFMRGLQPNNYAEISWDRQGDPNMDLFSNQWSVHAEATSAASSSGSHSQWNPKAGWDEATNGTNDVLPGGATLGLRIKSSNRQTVHVTTYYTATVGYGRHQCEVTEGNPGDMTEGMAEGYHAALTYNIANSLDNTVVQQWQSDKIKDSYAWDNGIRVFRTCDLHALKTGNNTASSENKYYFGNIYGVMGGDFIETGSNAGDYDVDVHIKTKYKCFTVYSDENGNICCAETTGHPGEFTVGDTSGEYARSALEARTNVFSKLEKAVEQATMGDDHLGGFSHSMYCKDEKALNGEKWYNEAFDGITIFVEESEITVGFIDPAERTEVLDPRLTQEQKAKSNMFAAGTFEMGQFKNREYSENYGVDLPEVLGDFENNVSRAQIRMHNLEYLFWTRRFLIPNTTVQDLY